MAHIFLFMGGGRLPGAPGMDEERIVYHVDMDCFYAACERLRDPDLEDKPVVVGMGYEDGGVHGVVATASYEAREYGVESAMGIQAALNRLPRVETARDDPALDMANAGHYRPVDMDYYQTISEDVMTILEETADVVRDVSIDEAYLDVTESTDWPHVEGVARHLRNRIRRQVGVTASVGVAPTMSAAKIASDYDKPNGLVIVEPGEVREFLAPLDIEDLHGIGPVTADELRAEGLQSIGDLADADESWLVEQYGARGRELYRRARGEDDRDVTPVGKPKSLSRESAFTEPVEDAETKREKVQTLAAAVADRARRKGALYRTVGIKAVEPPYDVNTRAKSLPGPIDDPAVVEEIALELLVEFANAPVRKLGVRVSNLSFSSEEQAQLEGWNRDEPPDTEPHIEESSRESDDDARESKSSPSGQSSLSEF